VTLLDLDVAPRPVGRPRPVMPSRPVALFVVGLLTLLVVTGSARPGPRFGGALWTAAYDRDDDTVTLTPTSLVLFHHDPGGPSLRAYDLVTGRVRWSAPAPDVVAQVPAVAGGVVVAADGFQRYFQRPDLLLARTDRTIARDARTGAVLWRLAGAPEAVTDRSVLLLDAEPGGAARLLSVGLRDGRTLWSRPARQLASVVVVGDTVVTADPDGRLTALRNADGSVTGSRSVPWPAYAWLTSAAGRLVVTAQLPSGQSSTVYRADTLALLWRADGGLTDCRAVLCGAEPGALIGYDPATGGRRWRVAGMTVAWPVGADRVVASSELNDRFQLLDPVTGRPVGAAGAGLGTWGADSRSVVDDAPPASSAFVLHGAPGVADETAVVRVDLRTGRRYPLGRVDGSGWYGCRTVAQYLICLRDNVVTVTATG
jgi:outer membrane protein assembly factor BamB